MKTRNSWFPNAYDMEQIDTPREQQLIFYNWKTDEIFSRSRRREEEYRIQITNSPKGFELVKQGDAAYNKIMAEIQRRKVNYMKQASRKKFVNNLISSMELKDAFITQQFLNGETEKTKGTDLFIDGEILRWYAITILKRIDGDNFMLGKCLSGYSGQQVSVANRILPVLASSDKVFWESTITWQAKYSEHYLYVVEHIKNKLAHCYLKWPWARKANKLIYKDQFEGTLKVLSKATKYFKVNFDLGPMHNIMIDTFGDRKEMVVQINAFRVSYEFTK